MIFHNTHEFKISSPTAVALGCFDGVHLGHKAVISEAIASAKHLSVLSAVWCFEEPPKNFFFPNSARVITTVAQKAELISELGVDVTVCVPFDNAIASLSPEEFFERILVEKMNAAHVVCGANFRFGKNGIGDTKTLSKLCKEHGIGFSVQSHVCADGMPVSSSAIREALMSGDIKTASALLGRPYSISGKVINGNRLGRTLGFPTANIAIEDGGALLKNGVYVTRALVDGEAHYGITNVGKHPTVSPNILLAETNLFDFCDDIYGKDIKIEFLEFIRPEVKFGSLDELSAQVQKDIETAKSFIAKKY